MNFLVGNIIQISKQSPADQVKPPIEEFVRVTAEDFPTREQRVQQDPLKQMDKCCS